MKRWSVWGSYILLGCLLAGCAGRNFVKASDNSLMLGASKTSDVIAKMGEPAQRGTITQNEKQINQLIYAYAVANPAEAAARGQHFFIYNDVLIGTEFVSSFTEDSSDFDESKITQIQKDQSTKDDVIALMGKPGGEFIYPLIKNPDERGLVYLYTKVSGGPFAMKIYTKSLVVSYRPDGIVSDVIYTSTGTKPE